MKTKLSNLTFNMNQRMFEYFCVASFLNEQLENVDKNSKDYELIQKEFQKYKQLFVEEFRTINEKEIEIFNRISD